MVNVVNVVPFVCTYRHNVWIKSRQPSSNGSPTQSKQPWYNASPAKSKQTWSNKSPTTSKRTWSTESPPTSKRTWSTERSFVSRFSSLICFGTLNNPRIYEPYNTVAKRGQRSKRGAFCVHLQTQCVDQFQATVIQ